MHCSLQQRKKLGVVRPNFGGSGPRPSSGCALQPVHTYTAIVVDRTWTRGAFGEFGGQILIFKRAHP